MTSSLGIPFAKYHGLGNDFIVVADSLLHLNGRAFRGAGMISNAPTAYLARLGCSICARHTGVGADGLLVLAPPENKKHDARMRVFNADGSEAEMSGNGIRCAAAYLIPKMRSRRTLLIETKAGVKSLDLLLPEAKSRRAVQGATKLGRWIFRVGMGTPVLEPAKIPFRAGNSSAPVVGFPLPTQKGSLKVTVTSMGNPHCSVFVEDFDAVDWQGLGHEIEASPFFPNRTNVEFVRVLSRREIEVRFWERGVGSTQSSGTGSCAAVVACILNGHTGRNVRVRTLAGSLEVAWPEKGEVALTGPVELIAEGTYNFPGR